MADFLGNFLADIIGLLFEPWINKLAVKWKRHKRKQATSSSQNWKSRNFWSEISGYLAYNHGISVGWCNANDKENYYRFGEFSLNELPLNEENVKDRSKEKIKSVVCFEIAPEYRGKGLATALLRRVCEDALKDGYEYVEAYPAIKGKGEYDFTGPVRLYKKLGFMILEQRGEMLIMRKKLIRKKQQIFSVSGIAKKTI